MVYNGYIMNLELTEVIVAKKGFELAGEIHA